MPIILYDIPSTFVDNAWSPNMWKARYCLNYKGLEHKSQWIEYPNIAEHSKKLGIAPTSKKPDGSPHYTLPAIHDTSTGAYISDSFAIALYLEETYPNTPSLFPHGTAALQAPFEGAFMGTGNMASVFPFTFGDAIKNLNPPSEAYFRRTREAEMGDTLENLTPKGEDAVMRWAKFREGMSKVDAWYAKNGGKGPFLLGETLSWGDLVICSYLRFLRTLWGHDQKWSDIESWDNGRWKTLIQNVEKYEAVV